MNRPMSLVQRTACTLVLSACAAAACAQAATPLTLTYNPGNTNVTSNIVLGVSVSADGRTLLMSTAPVGTYNGGLLNFGGYPWWVSVADFSAGNKVGTARTGDKYRGTANLPAPAGRQYTMATLAAGTSNVYVLEPVAMTGKIRGSTATWAGTMRGTITTDGRHGRLAPANIIDYDIVVEGTQTP